MNIKHIDTLSKSHIFKSIAYEDLKGMLNCINPKIRSYKKNEIVALAGERFDGVGIILEGECSVVKEMPSGRTILSILGPSEMFGEMAAFSGIDVWPATIFSGGDCKVSFFKALEITGQCEKACSHHKKLILNMLEVLAKKAIILNKKVDYLSIGSVRGKICMFLLEQCNGSQNNFEIPFNRNQTAEFLNIPRPSLSRELCKLRDEGIIDFHLQSFRILNLEMIKKFIN